jgi:hypothetical protein
VKVLSLTQPWATLMALDAKKIETRSWTTSHRGPIAIAASVSFPADCQRICLIEPYRSCLLAGGYKGPSDLPRGAILAVVDLIDVLPTQLIVRHGISAQEREFGDYNPFRFGWLTRNVRRLPRPLAFKGGQGLTKDIPDEVIARALAGEAVRA